MSRISENRRTFLRHAAEFGSAAMLGGMTGCVGGTPDLDIDRDDGDDATADESVLQAGMELGVIFTGPGGLTTRSEVDPDDPGGGRLVRVEDVDPGEEVTLGWRQTVEREIPPEEPADDEDDAEPEVEIVEETGTITATGLAAADQAFLPMFWDTGEMTNESSALWLSQEAFRDLEEGGETAWSPDVLTRISWGGEEVARGIANAVDEVGKDEVILEAEDDAVDVDLTVDDRSETLEAIEAYDSFGNEYIILANAENPLIVEFTYGVLSIGVTPLDTIVWTLIKAVFSGYEIVSLDRPA